MTLHCWMHWFWITLWTVITVFPLLTRALPLPLAVGEPSSEIGPTLQHQLTSVQNAVRRAAKPPPPPPAAAVKSAAALLSLTETRTEPPPPPPELGLVADARTNPPPSLNGSKSNKSALTETKALSLDQEQVKRKKLLVEAITPTGSKFPVPQVDDSGDSEGGLPLGLAAAAVGLLQPPLDTAANKANSVPATVNKELELHYNAVIADTVSTSISTNTTHCADCTTTSQDLLAEQIENATEVDASIGSEQPNNTGVSTAENLDNITSYLDNSELLPQEESTEEILSRSSLTVQESHDHPTGKMLSQASEDQDENQEGMDPGAIAGISLGVLAIATLASAASFVLYRTRYLNNPQTLSDKCSNPDSSGYIDDSTMRENSEEMYSLDNDSFLNSLEAMTIQNYWTDSVKHTKL